MSKRVKVALFAGASVLLTGAIVVFAVPTPFSIILPQTTNKGDTSSSNTEAQTRQAGQSEDAAQISGNQAASPQSIAAADSANPANITIATTPNGTPSVMRQDGSTVSKDKQAEDSAATPAFDIVRVGPAGDSVIAGRVSPGKRLELLVNGQVHDRLEPHASGAFALTPPTLPPGNLQLTLREIGSDGVGTLSRQSVTVVLSPDLVSPPVVALSEPDKPTIVLAGPGIVSHQPADDDLSGEDNESVAADEVAVNAPPILPKVVAITTVEAEAGRLYVSGNAPKESSVRLYLNDTFLAAGNASANGTLSFTIDSGITDGDYRVRLDEVSPKDGKVISRAEVPFVVQNAQLESTAAQQQTALSETPSSSTDRSTSSPGAEMANSDNSHVVVPEVRTTRVEHGDSLWQISKRAYGQGTRYTVIYGANQKQIRNPDLIYPGQTFVLPGNEEKPAAQ